MTSGFCTAFLGSLDGPDIEADCGEGREKMKLDSGVKM